MSQFSDLIAKAQAGDKQAMQRLMAATAEMNLAHMYATGRDPHQLDQEQEKGYMQLRQHAAQAGITPELLKQLAVVTSGLGNDPHLSPEDNAKLNDGVHQWKADNWKKALLDAIPGLEPTQAQPKQKEINFDAMEVNAVVPKKKVVPPKTTTTPAPPAKSVQQKAAQGILNILRGGGGEGGSIEGGGIPFDNALIEKR